MNDPKRWLEAGSDAPEGAAELLRSARPARAIDKATLSLSAAAAAKLAATPAAAAALPLAAKLAISACAAAAVGVVAVRTVAPPSVPATPTQHVAHQHSSARVRPGPSPSHPVLPESTQQPPAEPNEPAPSPALTQSPSEQVAPHKAPEHAAGRPRAALRSNEPVSRAAPPPDELAAEVASLDAARTLLQTDPKRALELATQHAALAPNATLAPERELIAIDALRRLGRGSEARARADALLSRYPGSIYQQRLENMLP